MTGATRRTAAVAVARRIVAEAVRLDPSGVQLRFGLRCAAGVAIVLVGSLVLGHPLAGVSAAVGAFIVGFASRQGVYRTRAAAMLFTSAAMGLATFVGAASAANPIASVAVAIAYSFGAGLLASLGPIATTIGLNSLVAIAIFGQFHASPLQALGLAGLVGAGGLLQTVLLVAAWPLARFGAERKVLSAAYRALGAYAGEFPRVKLRSPDATAFSALSTTLQDPQPFARRGEIAAFEALLLEAERIRASLGALAVDLHTLDRTGQTDAARALVSLGEGTRLVLERIASALEAAEAPSDWDDVWESLDARAARVEVRATTQTARDVRALLGQLRAAWRAAELPADSEHATQMARPSPLALARARDAVRTLRANLSPSSAFAQHGLRLALTIGIAETLSHVLPLQRGYWITLTAVLVLRPDFATTFSRGVARLLGTLLGAVLASLVALAHPGPEAYLGAALLFATIGFVVFNVNYAVFTTAVTAYVVFLLAFGGLPQHTALTDRIVASLIGGSLALLAYAFWPTWERDSVAIRLAELIEAQQAYSKFVLETYVAGAPAGDSGRERALVDAQRNAWRARSNAEASVDRMLAEPVPPTAVTVRAALGLLAASRRFGLAALTLQARTAGMTSSVPAARTLVEALDTSLAAIAEALRLRRDVAALPPLRDLFVALARECPKDHTPEMRAFLPEADLMVDSVNAVSDVLHRLSVARRTEH